MLPIRFTRLLHALLYRDERASAPRLAPVAASLPRPEGERRYLIATPDAPATAGRALVVMLHGAGASPEQVLGQAFPASPLSLWLEIAAREELVVLAPAAGKAGWSDCFAGPARVARQDDVTFIGALIDLAIARHGVDPARVYLIGVSRGGHMAYRVAAELPHKLAAFSAVLASMPPPGCASQPATPLSAQIVGATRDPLMPYGGGKYWYTLWFADPVGSIEDSARQWRALAGLPDVAQVHPVAKAHGWDKTRATRFVWGAARSGIQVELIKIEGGGHVEPSRRRRYPGFVQALVGRQNADVEVAEAAWEFFRDKRSGTNT